MEEKHQASHLINKWQKDYYNTLSLVLIQSTSLLLKCSQDKKTRAFCPEYNFFILLWLYFTEDFQKMIGGKDIGDRVN